MGRIVWHLILDTPDGPALLGIILHPGACAEFARIISATGTLATCVARAVGVAA